MIKIIINLKSIYNNIIFFYFFIYSFIFSLIHESITSLLLSNLFSSYLLYSLLFLIHLSIFFIHSILHSLLLLALPHQKSYPNHIELILRHSIILYSRFIIHSNLSILYLFLQSINQQILHNAEPFQKHSEMLT